MCLQSAQLSSATEKVEAEELKKAKEYIKGKLAMGLEGSDDVVEYLVSQETIRGEIMLPAEKAKMVDRVTADDVLRVAQDIFVNKKLNLAVIGPKASEAKLRRILNLES